MVCYRGAVAIVEEKELPPWRFCHVPSDFLGRKEREKKKRGGNETKHIEEALQIDGILSSKNVWYAGGLLNQPIPRILAKHSQIGSWIPKDGVNIVFCQTIIEKSSMLYVIYMFTLVFIYGSRFGTNYNNQSMFENQIFKIQKTNWVWYPLVKLT